jgi:hypothetical protein
MSHATIHDDPGLRAHDTLIAWLRQQEEALA